MVQEEEQCLCQFDRLDSDLCTMFVPLSLCFSVIISHAASTEIMKADHHPLRDLTAKNMGDYHNQVMEKVDERMRDNLPDDIDEYNAIVLDEVTKFGCTQGDAACEKHMVTALEDSVRRVRLHKIKADSLTNLDLGDLLPDELDKNTKAHFHNIHDTLSTLGEGKSSEENVENVVSALEQIIERVEGDESLDETRRTAVLGAASVAAGSTKYWAKALKDSDNSFRRLQVRSEKNGKDEMDESAIENFDIHGRRSLIIGSVFRLLVNVVEIVIADFIGAVVGSIDPTIDFIFASGAASPTPILWGAFLTATFDSVEATGIIIPAASLVVRCVLEDILTDVNCSVREMFCSDTTLCK